MLTITYTIICTKVSAKIRDEEWLLYTLTTESPRHWKHVICNLLFFA